MPAILDNPPGSTSRHACSCEHRSNLPAAGSARGRRSNSQAANPGWRRKASLRVSHMDASFRLEEMRFILPPAMRRGASRPGVTGSGFAPRGKVP